MKPRSEIDELRMTITLLRAIQKGVTLKLNNGETRTGLLLSVGEREIYLDSIPRGNGWKIGFYEIESIIIE